MMNYHEMTMDEPRNSPARRQQYLVICTIMAAMFAHTIITAGGLTSIVIEEGIFPGGDFVYRVNQRDYAATLGLFEDVANSLNISRREYPDLLYSLYLDDPSEMNARITRFATGILVGDAGKDMKDELLSRNGDIALKQKQQKQKNDDSTNIEKFRLKEWQYADLPSVDAAVLQFSHSRGFVSALIASYRLIPALRKYAQEKGEPGNVPVVITTCSLTLSMCTHYAPLVQGKDFLLGLPDSKTFAKEAADEDFIFDMKGMYEDAKRFFPPLRLILK